MRKISKVWTFHAINERGNKTQEKILKSLCFLYGDWENLCACFLLSDVPTNEGIPKLTYYNQTTDFFKRNKIELLIMELRNRTMTREEMEQILDNEDNSHHLIQIFVLRQLAIFRREILELIR